MEKLAIFGKGGIGKSTFAANLSAAYALRGLKVLLVGCDPKHDTTVSLTDGRPIRTVVDHGMFLDASGEDAARIVVTGRLGVDCIESGGPEPGTGCAGRGISRMIEVLEEGRLIERRSYDVVLFDVLGDVVCGGFAAPLRRGLADKVCIVVSEELMALYAANNIARAVRNYASNGLGLAGLVVNLRDPGADRRSLRRFARLIGTRVLAFAARDPAVPRAERLRTTVVEGFPSSGFSRCVRRLAGELLRFEPGDAVVPTPLSDERFHALSRVGFDPRAAPAAADAPLASWPIPPPDSPPRAPASAVESPTGLPRRARRALARDIASASWRVALRDGGQRSNAEQWGAPDQWRQFFCDFETYRNARTRLQLDAPVIEVWHQDLECSFATASFFGGHPSFFSFPWAQPRPGRTSPEAPGKSARRPPPTGREMDEDAGGRHSISLVTNLRELDVIHGGATRLEAALEAAVRASPQVQAVVINSTCVPTVIGDDAQAVVERFRKRFRVPMFYANPASNRFVDVAREIFGRIGRRPGASGVRRRPDAANLVGFPAGPALDETVQLLTEAGVTVNACVLPMLTPAQARRYLAAGTQVLNPIADYEETYREVFGAMPIRTVRPAAPYGWDGTKRWFEAVVETLGIERRRARGVFRRSSAPWRRTWDEGRAAASGHRLAFVVDGDRLDRLADASRLWGVPVVDCLQEMGFGVDILCHDDGRGVPASFQPFRTPDDLSRLLREGPFDAVYSEYFFDDRLARAGKASFSLSAFELGLPGAVRTLERLLEVCRWPFRRRYAQYLAPGRGAAPGAGGHP